MKLLDIASSFLTTYGYYFLFLAAIIENVPIIGLLMPGEVVVVAAGFFAARGDLGIIEVIIVAIVGGVIGNNIGYWAGRRGGRPMLEGLAARFHVHEKTIKYAEDYFDRHGAKTVFFGRYMAGLKAFVAALAGAAHMEYGLFFIYSSIGIISWTLIAALVGYFFGQYFDVVMGIFKAVGWGSLAIFILIIAGVYWWRKRAGREKGQG